MILRPMRSNIAVHPPGLAAQVTGRPAPASAAKPAGDRQR
jgi:hypothetical protein